MADRMRSSARMRATCTIIAEYGFKAEAIELRLRTGCKVEARACNTYSIAFDVCSDTNVEKVVCEIVDTITKLEEAVCEAQKHERALATLREDPHQCPICTKLEAELRDTLKIKDALGIEDDWKLVPPDAPSPPPPPKKVVPHYTADKPPPHYAPPHPTARCFPKSDKSEVVTTAKEMADEAPLTPLPSRLRHPVTSAASPYPSLRPPKAEVALTVDESMTIIHRKENDSGEN